MRSGSEVWLGAGCLVGEDRNCTRTDRAPENLALVRRTALNLVRQNGYPKESIKRRRLRASLNDD